MKDDLGLRNDVHAMLVGESKAITEVRGLIQYAATSDIPVMMTGPSGSGKQAAARLIHFRSLRREKRFVATNCSIFPGDLMESELFGHEKGSFAETFARRRGTFEMAEDGTLFLDAIGDLPLDIQDKILRVLTEKRWRRWAGKGLPKSIHGSFRQPTKISNWPLMKSGFWKTCCSVCLFFR